MFRTAYISRVDANSFKEAFESAQKTNTSLTAPPDSTEDQPVKPEEPAEESAEATGEVKPETESKPEEEVKESEATEEKKEEVEEEKKD